MKYGRSWIILKKEGRVIYLAHPLKRNIMFWDLTFSDVIFTHLKLNDWLVSVCSLLLGEISHRQGATTAHWQTGAVVRSLNGI